jgi:3-oxoacyl-[acyl-carrier protein] reductase
MRRFHPVAPTTSSTVTPASMATRVSSSPSAARGSFDEPEEVADVVLFLASDLSRYLTGTAIEISGGRHI